MKKFVTIINGMVMGIAEVIPGVSGSTLALIMGIYDKFVDLLHDLSDLVKIFIQIILGQKKVGDLKTKFQAINFEFAILLGIGMGISITMFSFVFLYLIDEFPQYVYAFFFGLIAASVLAPWKRMETKNIPELMIIIGTGIFFFVLFGISSPEQFTNPSTILLFFGGIISISGMVLPGVSGSFLLFLLGLYEYIFSTIRLIIRLEAKSSDIINLVVFALGIFIGFAGFIRILKVALKKYPTQLMAFLIGLMIASLRILWPFMDTSVTDEVENMPKVLPTDLDIGEMFIILGVIIITYIITLFIIIKGKEGEEIEK